MRAKIRALSRELSGLKSRESLMILGFLLIIGLFFWMVGPTCHEQYPDDCRSGFDPDEGGSGGG